MKFINNQPVKFDPPSNDCHLDYRTLHQKVNQGDITHFQERIGDCFRSEQKIPNGGFTASLANWNVINFQYDAGQASSSGGYGELKQTVLNVGFYYRVKIIVNSIKKLDTTSGAGELRVLLGTNEIGTITTAGTYNFFGICKVIDFIKIIKNADTEVLIEEVSAWESTIDYIFGIYNQDGALVTSLEVTDFITPTVTETDEFSIRQSFLSTFINWTGLSVSNGCYRIGVLDACVNTDSQNYLHNGDFNSPETSLQVGWAQTETGTGTDSAIINGVWTHFGVSLGAESQITQTVLGTGKTYNLVYKINALTNANFQITLGTVTGAVRTLPGIYSETITTDGTDIIATMGDIAVGTSSGEIEYIHITADSSDWVVDNYSNWFDLKTSHACTLRLNACNDPKQTDDFGFYFKDSGFSPNVRVWAKLVGAQYPREREVEEGSDGRRKVRYFKRRKTKELRISAQPEYIHDFLSSLAGYDTFYIDNVEYVVTDDEYQIGAYNEDNQANVILEVTEAKELFRNMICESCGENCPGCQVGEVNLIYSDGEDVETSDGEPVIIG